MNFRMTIGNKLLLSFGALIVVTLVLSASALKAISDLRESFDLAINQTVEKSLLAGAIITADSGSSTNWFARSPAASTSRIARFVSPAS